MTAFIVYLDNGKIVRGGTCQEVAVELQAGQGEYVLESDADVNANFVVDGVVTPLPVKPDGDYEFDYLTKQWVFNTELATSKAISLRNKLLADGPDRINPIWFSAMTTEQQQAWADYRQALLDITDQSGFPMMIDWPARPDQAA